MEVRDLVKSAINIDITTIISFSFIFSKNKKQVTNFALFSNTFTHCVTKNVTFCTFVLLLSSRYYVLSFCYYYVIFNNKKTQEALSRVITTILNRCQYVHLSFYYILPTLSSINPSVSVALHLQLAQHALFRFLHSLHIL